MIITSPLSRAFETAKVVVPGTHPLTLAKIMFRKLRAAKELKLKILVIVTELLLMLKGRQTDGNF